MDTLVGKALATLIEAKEKEVDINALLRSRLSAQEWQSLNAMTVFDLLRAVTVADFVKLIELS